MKHLFMLAFAVCATAFMGCSKDDEGAAGDLAGMWADTFESGNEECAVDVYEIKGNKMIIWNCTNMSDIFYEPTYANGTLSSKNEAIFEINWTVNISVSDSHLSAGEFRDLKYKKISEDKIQLWDEEDPEDMMTWQRIHNTENIVFK